MQRSAVDVEQLDVKDVRTGVGGPQFAVECSQVVKLQNACESGGHMPRVSFAVALKAGEQILADFDGRIQCNPAADRDDYATV